MLDQCWVLFPLLLVYMTTVECFVPNYSKSINAFAAHSSTPTFDYRSEMKLPWQSQGYSSWLWNGYKINYVDLGGEGADDSLPKQPLLLIHGFGASVYHWRYNIPFLARKYHVYAIDMIGFGLSDKPIIDYSAELWRDQVLSFIEEVVMRDKQMDDRMPCVVAGNSLGGFTALYASSSERAVSNKLIGGCILLNAAGRFRSDESVVVKEPSPKWVIDLQSFFQRLVIGMSFLYTKQPQRIAQVLRQVYPVDPSNVDDELVESIQYPAQNENAAEVFYRVIAKNGNGPPVFVDDLLRTLQVPLLLLWGVKDPWIRPQAAEKIQSLFPDALRVDVDAGHCPHDEAPQACNKAIDEFMQMHVVSVQQ